MESKSCLILGKLPTSSSFNVFSVFVKKSIQEKCEIARISTIGVTRENIKQLFLENHLLLSSYLLRDENWFRSTRTC
jgi:ABC-type lipoprotein release transport system permease subunit